MFRIFHLPTVWVSQSLVHQLPCYFRSTYKRISIHVKSITISLHRRAPREALLYTKKRNFFFLKKDFNFFSFNPVWTYKKFFFLDHMTKTINNMAPDIKQHTTDQFVLANLILFIYFIYLILPTSFALH